MSELEWAIASAQAAADAAPSYEDRAFYVALQDFFARTGAPRGVGRR
ncbi:hypothetical protein [Lacticaseibacillus nasuensis]|nr:hypothetical protein [Lacticaseibacillus nasuensis]